MDLSGIKPFEDRLHERTNLAGIEEDLFLSIKSGRAFAMGSSLSLRAIIPLMSTLTLCDANEEPFGRVAGASNNFVIASAIFDCRESLIYFECTVSLAVLSKGL